MLSNLKGVSFKQCIIGSYFLIDSADLCLLIPMLRLFKVIIHRIELKSIILLYVFASQKNSSSIAVPNTFVVALTNKRLLFARKRLFFGYFFYAVTPDMFNDLKVNSGIIWGQIVIDTVKELAYISNVSKDALDEIETAITEYMMEEKKKYPQRKDAK